MNRVQVQKRLVWVIASAAFCLSGAVHAHHSFAATYFVGQQMQIEGQVVQFMFRNPHTFIHVMAPDKDGKMQRWAIEWGGAAALAQSGGVNKDTLKSGDRVIVMGEPGRNPADHRLRLLNITRPADGWEWGGDFE